MKVEILVDVSDERRSYRIGDVCDLPDDQARRWIKAGFAVDAAALKGGEEKATMPKAEKRG
jgi:hypothetical protein